MKNVHKLTEGAVLLAVFTVLILITIYIPVLGIVSNLFLAIPFILFSAKNTRMSAFVFFIASLLLSFIFGNIYAIPLTLLNGWTGLVIGLYLQAGKSRFASYIGATITYLAGLLLIYVTAVVFFKINFINEFMTQMKESFTISKGMLEAFGQTSDETKLMEQFEAFLQLFEALIPSLFVIGALFSVFLIELVSFPIIKRFGVQVERWKPIRELVFPKSILWYYLAVLVISLLFKPEEGSYWSLAIINIGFILQLLMVFQGISFIFYICYQKGLSKAIPIVATILTFLFPFFLSIVRILGIIDIGFDLRKRLEKS